MNICEIKSSIKKLHELILFYDPTDYEDREFKYNISVALEELNNNFIAYESRKTHAEMMTGLQAHAGWESFNQLTGRYDK